jgi:hypothetical protein
MFENLDDPNAPDPAPVENVVARGRQLRLHRRMLLVATSLLVIAGTITSVAALQGGGGHKRVQVSNESSSTSEPPTTAVVPDSTVPGSTVPTTDTTPPSTVGNVVPPTPPPATTTTQPPHDPNDLSMVTITYQGETGVPNAANVAIPTGQEKPFTYTVTNNGSWDVTFGTCGDNEFVSLWSNPATQAWPPYSDGIWPMPYPDHTGAQPDVCAQSAVALSPGSSLTRTVTLLAGYHDAAGNVFPAPPGFTAYRAPLFGSCAQPCDTGTPNSAWVTVEPPVWPAPPSIYSIVYKTQHMSIPSGQSADAEITYTNGLAFAVQIPLYGPCWRDVLGHATVDCSGPRPVLTIGPHESADLHGAVWARQGFVQSGAPLAKGRYPINMGDRRSETLGYTAAEATWVDVS